MPPPSMKLSGANLTTPVYHGGVKPKLPSNATFFIRFAIILLETFVAGTPNLTDQQKIDIEATIQSGEKVLADFGG